MTTKRDRAPLAGTSRSGSKRAKDGTIRGHEAGNNRPKLEGALLTAFLSKVREGIPWTIAARTVGVWPNAITEKKDRDPAFEADFEAARADAQESLLRKTIALAESGERTQGMTWLLERLFPKTFGPPPKELQHSGPEGGPIETAVTVTIEQARAGARGEGPK